MLYADQPHWQYRFSGLQWEPSLPDWVRCGFLRRAVSSITENSSEKHQVLYKYIPIVTWKSLLLTVDTNGVVFRVLIRDSLGCLHFSDVVPLCLPEKYITLEKGSPKSTPGASRRLLHVFEYKFAPPGRHNSYQCTARAWECLSRQSWVGLRDEVRVVEWRILFHWYFFVVFVSRDHKQGFLCPNALVETALCFSPACCSHIPCLMGQKSLLLPPSKCFHKLLGLRRTSGGHIPSVTQSSPNLVISLWLCHWDTDSHLLHELLTWICLFTSLSAFSKLHLR